MNKKRKLYNLRLGISSRSQWLTCLLEHIKCNSENQLESSIFASIALEQTKKIGRMSEKIGLILKH